jgi:hypothetical protein
MGDFDHEMPKLPRFNKGAIVGPYMGKRPAFFFLALQLNKVVPSTARLMGRDDIAAWRRAGIVRDQMPASRSFDVPGEEIRDITAVGVPVC